MSPANPAQSECCFIADAVPDALARGKCQTSFRRGPPSHPSPRRATTAIFAHFPARTAGTEPLARPILPPMNTTSPDLIFSTEGFTNRADLAAHAEEKAKKLRRRLHPRIDLVRVHIKHESPHSSPAHFAVRATAVTAGPDLVAHAESTEPTAALNAAFEKLERALAASAGALRHARHKQSVKTS